MAVEWAARQLLKVGRLAGGDEGFVLLSQTHLPTEQYPRGRWGCVIYRRCALAVCGITQEQMAENFDTPEHYHIKHMFKEVESDEHARWIGEEGGALITPDQVAAQLDWRSGGSGA